MNMIYSNAHYAIYFVPNGTPEKEHDFTKQFTIVNMHLGTVEAQVGSFPHAVQYCDVFAADWEALVMNAKGQFNPEIQGNDNGADKAEAKAGLKLATVDGENV
ncbi:hypothetical protein [Escherichia phage PJNS034]